MELIAYSIFLSALILALTAVDLVSIVMGAQDAPLGQSLVGHLMGYVAAAVVASLPFVGVYLAILLIRGVGL